MLSIFKRQSKASAPQKQPPSTSSVSSRTPLTFIGKSGEGKSTACNQILGKRQFLTSGRAQSCTETISSCDVPDTNITLYDTPGIGDTEGRSEEFFQLITDHLHEHGGVIAFVQSHSRVDQRVKNHLHALSLVLEGLPFSTCCVLITTKLDYDLQLTPEENMVNRHKYQSELEESCFAAVERNDLFARRYAFTTFVPETQQEFVRNIKKDIPELRGIAPGMVLTWNTILKLSENRVTDAKEQEKLLQGEVDRLEQVVKSIQYNKKWHQICIGTCTAAYGVTGGGLAIVVEIIEFSAAMAVVGVALAMAYHVSIRAVIELDKRLPLVRADLEKARENLRHLDMRALTAKAERIRELVK